MRNVHIRDADFTGSTMFHVTLKDVTTNEQCQQSIDGEWSFIQTLRHLVMAMDKWFTLPVLGQAEMHPIILPNGGSNDFPWPGRDLTADSTYTDVLAVRAERAARFREFIASVTSNELARTTTVLENGEATVEQCLHVVFEEEFEHLRYAMRDLDRLS